LPRSRRCSDDGRSGLLAAGRQRALPGAGDMAPRDGRQMLSSQSSTGAAHPRPALRAQGRSPGSQRATAAGKLTILQSTKAISAWSPPTKLAWISVAGAGGEIRARPASYAWQHRCTAAGIQEKAKWRNRAVDARRELVVKLLVEVGQSILKPTILGRETCEISEFGC